MDQMKQKKPVYQRTTELRHVRDNDIYELIRMLDENECWRQLMEIIPKRFDAFASSAPGALKYDEIISVYGCKYTPSDIKLVENACGRSGSYEYHSAILFEEWKTSGKSNERPTLGVLLQLLVHADLYRAADFVAEKLLNEPKPLRPTDGPAAVVMLDTDEIMDYDSESSLHPSTNTLNDDAHRNFTEAYNKDFFTKHRVLTDKDMSNIKPNNVVPIPPPRTRSSRQLEQNQRLNANMVTPNTSTPYEVVTANSNNQLLPTADSATVDSLKQSSRNIPKLSLLIAMSTNSTDVSTSNDENGRSMNEGSTNETDLSEMGNQNVAPLEANIPMVSLLCDISNLMSGEGAVSTSRATTDTANSTATTTTTVEISSNCVSANSTNLPLISELNLLGDRERRDSGAITTTNTGGVRSRNNSESSYSNDDDVDDDDDDGDGDVSLPNLSNFDQRSSNNDSSLTTVTGTSGDNSFELTNDSSSASNDDNIPDLSALQKK